MEENEIELEKILAKVPKGLPNYLRMLCTAGHLYEAGLGCVESVSLHEEGLPCHGLIFAPVILCDDDNGEINGQIPFMFEIKASYLLTLQEAANDIGVTYRTIQRWRDEKQIFCIEYNGKQYVPSEILKDVAKQKGHK